MKRIICCYLILTLLLTSCAVFSPGGEEPNLPPSAENSVPEEPETGLPEWVNLLRAGMSRAEVGSLAGVQLDAADSKGIQTEAFGYEAECSFLFNQIDELNHCTVTFNNLPQEFDDFAACWDEIAGFLIEIYGETTYGDGELSLSWEIEEPDNPIRTVSLDWFDFYYPKTILLGWTFEPTETVPMANIEPKGSLSEQYMPQYLGWNATEKDVYAALGYIRRSLMDFQNPEEEYCQYTAPVVVASFESILGYRPMEFLGEKAYLNAIFGHNPDYVQEGEYDRDGDTRLIGLEYTFTFADEAEQEVFYQKSKDEITSAAGEGIKDRIFEKYTWRFEMAGEAMRQIELSTYTAYVKDADEYVMTPAVTLKIYTQQDVYKRVAETIEGIKDGETSGWIAHYESLLMWVVETEDEYLRSMYICLTETEVFVLRGGETNEPLPVDELGDYIEAYPDAVFTFTVRDGVVTEIAEQIMP